LKELGLSGLGIHGDLNGDRPVHPSGAVLRAQEEYGGSGLLGTELEFAQLNGGLLNAQDALSDPKHDDVKEAAS